MKLTDVATGRIQTIEPNLQNLPKGEIKFEVTSDKEKKEYVLNIRNAFICAPKRVLISADYRETELRLMAHACEGRNQVYLLVHRPKAYRFLYKSSRRRLFQVGGQKLLREEARGGTIVNKKVT